MKLFLEDIFCQLEYFSCQLIEYIDFRDNNLYLIEVKSNTVLVLAFLEFPNKIYGRVYLRNKLRSWFSIQQLHIHSCQLERYLVTSFMRYIDNQLPTVNNNPWILKLYFDFWKIDFYVGFHIRHNAHQTINDASGCFRVYVCRLLEEVKKERSNPNGFYKLDNEGYEVLWESKLLFLYFRIESHKFALLFELDVDKIIMLVIVQVQVFMDAWIVQKKIFASDFGTEIVLIHKI